MSSPVIEAQVERRINNNDGGRPAGPRAGLRACYGVLALVLAGYLVALLLRPTGSSWTWLDGWVVCAVELVASGLCIARAFVRRPRQPAALFLGVSLLAWTVGDIALTVESLGGATPPSPSLADAFYLSFYPFAYIGLMLFVGRQVKRAARSRWLDGAIAGLGAAASCSAFAFHRLLLSTGKGVVATVTNLAYPIGDVLLLGLVIAGFALLSRRSKGPWVLLAGGMALNVIGDTANLFQKTFGTTRAGYAFDGIAWPVAIVAMSLAMWLRQRPGNPLQPEKPAGFAFPNLSAAAALMVLLTGSLRSVAPVAVGLATGTLALAGIRLILSMRAMQRLSQERHRQSVTDELTGLRNRRYLFNVLDAFFLESAESSTPRSLAFLFIDLNHFKEINDSFGHPAGDQLLKQLGGRMRDSVRGTDLLVRVGGDEFAIVLIDGDAAYAMEVARRVTTCLREPFHLGAVTTGIGASIGIAMAPADATDSAGLVWCSDVAMYRAKTAGVPFASYEVGLDEDGNQLRLLEELRGAISHGGLVLHYQPQLDLRTGDVVAVEALLRWLHPKLGLLPPAKFLPLAEEAGLMRQLTQFVLDEAISQCALWRDSGRTLTMSVNVSPVDLLAAGFVHMVLSGLERHGLAGSALVLEITENGVISDMVRARHVIEELEAHDVVVSIDDFGAGVTSLAYLSGLSVRELKLDRSFIAGLEAEDNERTIELVRSTIELGHSMGLQIVAEGVEDSSTLELLAEMGCDIAQGYCISRPKPALELAFRRTIEVPPAVHA